MSIYQHAIIYDYTVADQTILNARENTSLQKIATWCFSRRMIEET